MANVPHRQIYGGSVIGPGHIKAGLPNQDAWRMMYTYLSDCVVVADGLGSRNFSHVGSNAVCDSAISCIKRFSQRPHEYTPERFVDAVRKGFLRKIRPHTDYACATTCLIAWRFNEVLRLFQIGDGLIATILADGSVAELREDKEDSFSNLVDPLTEETKPGAWRMAEYRGDVWRGVLMCTDGVSEDLRDVAGFVRDIVAENRGCGSHAASRSVREILSNWPVPKHTDDKTLACIIREEV